MRRRGAPGVDPGIEGRLYIYSVDCCGVHLSVHAQYSSIWACSPELPQKNFDHMRALLRPSETTITTQNLWPMECNSGNSLQGHFSEPLPSESAFVFEVLLQNCLMVEAAVLNGLCWQDMKLCRDMGCVRVARCTEHTVHLCGLCLLSPKGRPQSWIHPKALNCTMNVRKCYSNICWDLS